MNLRDSKKDSKGVILSIFTQLIIQFLNLDSIFESFFNLQNCWTSNQDSKRDSQNESNQKKIESEVEILLKSGFWTWIPTHEPRIWPALGAVAWAQKQYTVILIISTVHRSWLSFLGACRIGATWVMDVSFYVNQLSKCVALRQLTVTGAMEYCTHAGYD